MRVSYAMALLLIACAAEAPEVTGESKLLPPRGRTDVSNAPRKVTLQREQSHYLTVQRSADGTLRTRCVQGEIPAQQSLSVPAPSSFLLPPKPPRSPP